MTKDETKRNETKLNAATNRSSFFFPSFFHYANCAWNVKEKERKRKRESANKSANNELTRENSAIITEANAPRYIRQRMPASASELAEWIFHDFTWKYVETHLCYRSCDSLKNNRHRSHRSADRGRYLKARHAPIFELAFLSTSRSMTRFNFAVNILESFLKSFPFSIQHQIRYTREYLEIWQIAREGRKEKVENNCLTCSKRRQSLGTDTCDTGLANVGHFSRTRVESDKYTWLLFINVKNISSVSSGTC